MALPKSPLKTYELTWAADGRVEIVESHYLKYTSEHGSGGNGHIVFILSEVGTILSVREADVTSVRMIKIEEANDGEGHSKED